MGELAADTNATRDRTVLLWPDTFNNHFHPSTLKAALEVLEGAGCKVIVPKRWVCCGRPLYDFGMLKQAKRRLQHTLSVLQQEIREGIPIVGLEPSCISVFRDELGGLLAGDNDAKRLKNQVLTLAEYLDDLGVEFPRLNRKALIHGHCHQKAIMKMDADYAILEKLGLDVSAPEPGCCGMAGAFGFERGDHYNVSMTVARRSLVPAVEKAEKTTLIVADGYSCREQIAQSTDRHALHLAEVIRMGMDQDVTPVNYPERAYLQPLASTTTKVRKSLLIGIGALVGASFLVLAFSKALHKRN